MSYGSGDRAVAVPAERWVQTVISVANAGHIPLDTVQGCFALQLEATAHHEWPAAIAIVPFTHAAWKCCPWRRQTWPPPLSRSGWMETHQWRAPWPTAASSMADNVETGPDEQHGVSGSGEVGLLVVSLLSWSRLWMTLLLTLPAARWPLLSTLAVAVMLLRDVGTINLSSCLPVDQGCPVCLLSDALPLLSNRSQFLNDWVAHYN